MTPRSAIVNEQRREESKAVILQAAHALFKNQGYDSTTLAQVSRRAGVSVGLTVYYFRTKQHLVQALADRILHARVLHTARSAHPTADAHLAAVIDTVLQTAAAEPEIIAAHLALWLQPGIAEALADAEHHFEEQLPAAIAPVLTARGVEDIQQAFLQFRADMMGASYGIVSPYLPMPLTLTRKRLFTAYALDWDLGNHP